MFSGSVGSPPSTESPFTYEGCRLSSTLSSTERSKGFPAEKDQASALKQPLQCRRHPDTKTVVRTPMPLAMSQYLMLA
jgi:hypothetical protein